MPRKPKSQPRTPGESSRQEVDHQATALLEPDSSDIIPPTSEEPDPTCDSCRFWSRIALNPRTWGYCKRQLVPLLIPNQLTPFGPRGTYLVTDQKDWCGNYEHEENY